MHLLHTGKITFKGLFTFFFILIVFSHSLWAGLPVAFSPDLRPIKVPAPLYLNYLRPQLKGILAAFYTTLKRLHPLEENFIQMKEDWVKIEEERRQWAQSCSLQKSPQCRELAKNISKSIALIEAEALKTLALNSREKSIEQNFKTYEGEEDETTLNIHFLLEKVLNYCTSLNLFLDQFFFQLKTKQKNNASKEIYFESLLLELDVTLDLLLIEPTPYLSREKLRLFWANFAKKIEKNIILEDQPKYLGNNLGDLNFILNEFNVYMDKKRNPVARAFSNDFEDIHNRWNGILRILLD